MRIRELGEVFFFKIFSHVTDGVYYTAKDSG